MVLNLDPTFIVDFKDYDIRKCEFESFYFPGGEFHVKLKTWDDHVIITNRIITSNDIMEILIAADALRRAGTKKLSLYIPYIPYARQDRVAVDGESLTIKVFADLINSVGFEQVIVLDPHSDVAPALINNCKVISNHAFVFQCLNEIKGKHLSHSDLVLVSPDFGARKKFDKLVAKYDPNNFCVKAYGEKHRDIYSGKLSGFTVDSPLYKDERTIIIDDICDGGGTFIGLAKELKAKGAGDLYLIVTHGIFSKGLTGLQEYFKGIYTTNSFHDTLHGVEIKTIQI